MNSFKPVFSIWRLYCFTIEMMFVWSMAFSAYR